MVKKYNVTKERINRFALVNEEMFEKTAYAESQAYATFKDLSLLQVHVIRLIEYHKPCTMGKLAKSMGLSLGSITQLIDRLIRKDYVRRARSTEDRRVVFAELTTKGKKVIKASRKHVDTVALDILAKFTESEQEAVLDLFEKMIEP
jgi:DNA-binding MarR family transcriptional regulator